MFIYLLSLLLRFARRSSQHTDDNHEPSSIRLVAQVSATPEVVVAMAEGAQQVSEGATAVDVLIPTSDHADNLADIIEAVEPFAQQSGSIDLIGGTVHAEDAMIHVHFRPTEQDG